MDAERFLRQVRTFTRSSYICLC